MGRETRVEHLDQPVFAWRWVGFGWPAPALRLSWRRGGAHSRSGRVIVRRIGILFAAWALLLPFGAAAEGPLKVLTLNYKPYSYLSETKVEGINTDIVRELFRRAGTEIEIAVKPWARVLREAKRGRVDASHEACDRAELGVQIKLVDEDLPRPR